MNELLNLVAVAAQEPREVDMHGNDPGKRFTVLALHRSPTSKP